MKINLLPFLKIVIHWLQRQYDKLSENTTANAYSSLSPIDNADPDNHYCNAFEWALKNRKRESIRNIALTGPYGSGKTSILKTFQKRYSEKDLHFLNISLATFKEELESKVKPTENETLRLIELSIIQQIFYCEKDENIPDSRFKKIKSFSKLKLFLSAFGFFLFTIAILYLNNPNLIQLFLKDYIINNFVSSIIHYAMYSTIAVGIFLVLTKCIPIISSITLNKLKIHDAEFGLGGSLDKSILNHNLDEILYFFEVRPYNVVIIEDLDRFQQTEIFTKLREINLLLNSSKKTKNKDIVFIYAISPTCSKNINIPIKRINILSNHEGFRSKSPLNT